MRGYAALSAAQWLPKAVTSQETQKRPSLRATWFPGEGETAGPSAHFKWFDCRLRAFTAKLLMDNDVTV